MAHFLVVQKSHAEFLGNLEDPLEARGLGFTYVRPFVGDDLPATPGRYDALWLLGGPGGPTDADGPPWLAAELRLIAAFRRARRPVIGLGSGALVVVRAAGGVPSPGCVEDARWVTAQVTPAGQGDDVAAALAGARVLSMHAGEVALPQNVPALVTDADGRWLLARPDPLTCAVAFRPDVKPAILEDIVMEGGRECPRGMEAALAEARATHESNLRVTLRVVAALVRALDLMTERRKPPIIPIRAAGSDG